MMPLAASPPHPLLSECFHWLTDCLPACTNITNIITIIAIAIVMVVCVSTRRRHTDHLCTHNTNTRIISLVVVPKDNLTIVWLTVCMFQPIIHWHLQCHVAIYSHSHQDIALPGPCTILAVPVALSVRHSQRSARVARGLLCQFQTSANWFVMSPLFVTSNDDNLCFTCS